MNNFLKNKRLYLSGPIENSDNKINWRIDIINKLNQFEMEIFDPFSDPKQQWVPELQKARLEKNYKKMHEIAKGFVRKDLSLVDRADILLAYLPYKVATYGTIEEIVTAARAKKPCLLISDKSKEYVPLWFYGYIPHEQMFGNWDDLINYLKEINEGKHMNNNRWSYIYDLI